MKEEAQAAEPITKKTQTRARHFREYMPTFLTEFSILLSQILVFRLAAHYLGKDGFSQYAVARRAVSTLVPLPMLGLQVGLTRYISRSAARCDSEAADRYYGAALRCVGLSLFLSLIILNLANGYVAFVFFGDREYSPLVLPITMMLSGLVVHSTVYAYFRGHLAMIRANLLQFVNLGLVPLICFLLVHDSAHRILLLLGASWCLVALAGICLTPAHRIFLSTRTDYFELLRYGIQRVPGDFILMAFLALPVIFVAHRNGVQQAGFVAFGMSVLSMIAALFTPIGLVLLPKAGGLLAKGDNMQLRSHIFGIIRACSAVSGIATVLLLVFAARIIDIYLGPGFRQATTVLQLTILSAVPYALFSVLRNLIDAFHRNAVTALITAAGFVVFVVASSINLFHSTNQVLVSLLLGMCALGVGACWESFRILRRHALRPVLED
jgi:O-antigen/teichoic acid export membrane protein